MDALYELHGAREYLLHDKNESLFLVRCNAEFRDKTNLNAIRKL